MPFAQIAKKFALVIQNAALFFSGGCIYCFMLLHNVSFGLRFVAILNDEAVPCPSFGKSSCFLQQT
ncbi:hypothetical protein IM774_06500 [Erysipelotrichaceae bacterium RD49]|nr:hypothetical protein [Erysipelotrichaceae bacterium RD49]